MAAHRSKRRRFAPSVALLAGVMSWMLLGVQTAQAAPLNVTAAGLQLKLGWHVNVEATLCDNTGSYVTIDGDATLAALGMEVRFRNQTQNDNAKTKYKEAVVSLKLDETTGLDGNNNGWNGGDFQIRKQPAFGGVGGNPYISFDPDGGDDESTIGIIEGSEFDPVVLGRCVQGNKWGLNMTDDIPVDALGIGRAVSCETKSSRLNLDTDASTDDVNGMVLFDNNINKVVHQKEAAATWEVSTVGGWTNLKKGWGANGFGGNPWIDGWFYTGPGDWVNHDLLTLPDPTGLLTPDVWVFRTDNASMLARDYGDPSLVDRCKNMLSA